MIIADKLSRLSFSALMDVYLEGNLEKAGEAYFDLPEYAGLAQAEQDFYHYLRECFFNTPGARYAVWEVGSKYISAVRWEPYQDGVLISALETAPSYRNRGYGTRLLRAVLDLLDGPVYSHVGKNNLESLAVHKKCGFQIVSDSARYLDGSVNNRSFTLCKK